LFLIGALAPLLACQRSSSDTTGPGTNSNAATEIRVQPSNVLVMQSQSVPLRAIVLDQNGDTLSSAGVEWVSADQGIVTVDATGILTGVSVGETSVTARRSGLTAILAAKVVARSGNASLTPNALKVILGPLVLREAVSIPADVASALSNYDRRYMSTEMARFQDFVASESDPNGSWLNGNHYGGLRGRLGWAIRNGEPYGAGVTDESRYAYARGRRIIKKYLQYSKSGRYLTQAHHNTGLADVEALYVLEGDTDALTHIHVTAQSVTTDPYNYLKMQNPNADARAIAIAIQATTTAHRLGIPFARNNANPSVAFDATPGSWKGVARRQIQWLTDYNVVKADGSVPSPVENGGEAFLFNAMLAKELLQYAGNVEWDASVVALARRIMDHLIERYTTVYAPRGWSTLPYVNNSASSAPDLAAFYIWPSLALWQETGEQKYYDFAVQNVKATNSAYIAAMKQWNQVYSTMAEGAEALFSGQPWR
jgi:hypothetical protein